ncbi:hypothetical protein, partial [Tateyamaria sp.]|uniref:hypothetical protein n=1 Tax=Tateyamaria sp. TaxID=1929288 RepID=UPI00329B57A1
MTVFLHLLAEKDKAASILNSCSALRASYESPHVFSVKPDAFRKIPGAPFAYWVSDAVRNSFVAHPAFERETRFALGGLKTLSDPRFLRLWWEPQSGQTIWKPIAKGGKFARIYGDISLVVCWKHEGLDISWYGYQRRPREGFGASSRGLEAYFRPGLTWARRTQGGFSIRAMPKGCIFADKGPAAFVSDDDSDELLATLALTNSRAFGHLVSLQMAFGSYEVGVIQRTPVPEISGTERTKLENCARNFWGLRRIIKTVNETSHAFLLPAALRARLGEYAPPAIESELADIQAEIDDIAFDLYGFSDIDRAAALGSSGTADEEASDA